MTVKVAGSNSSAPVILSATSVVAMLADVAAATIPRGAIHPTNIRSRHDNPDPTVINNAIPGRTIRIRIAAVAIAGTNRGRSDAGVTNAD